MSLRDPDDIPLFSGASAIQSYEQFIGSIRVPPDAKTAFPIPDENILRYYSYSERQPAFVKVCDFLEDVLNDSSGAVDYKVPLKSGYFKNEAKMSLLTLYASISRATGIKLSKITPIKKNAFINAERGSTDYSPQALRQSFELRLKPVYESAEKGEWGRL